MTEGGMFKTEATFFNDFFEFDMPFLPANSLYTSNEPTSSLEDTEGEREAGEPVSVADEDDACASGECDEKMSMEQVFDMLHNAEQGFMDPTIPQRPQASPISPDVNRFFVNPSLKHTLSDLEREETLGDPNSLIPVKYQGFSNGELWWSARHGQCKGLVARNMTRKARNARNMMEHGFAGRWYTLISRASPGVVVEKSNCRNFIVSGVPSMVQFWRIEDQHTTTRPKLKRQRSDEVSSADGRCSLSSRGSIETEMHSHMEGLTAAKRTYSPRSRPSLESHSTSPSSRISQTYSSGSSTHSWSQCDGPMMVDSNLHVRGDCIIEGDLVANNVRVLGQLSVDGGIHGQLMTPPNAADYAEWFPCLHATENIQCGHVVQLRSPQQRLTLDTSGSGPIMVVSTSPSVAAGVPPGASKNDGRLVAFIGQVPVRCVGPIKCGDHLFPSGRGDGLAVAGDSRHTDMEPLATAMVSCGPGIHSVNSFVRWPHNREWSSRRHRANHLSITTVNSWRLVTLYLVYLLCRGYFMLDSTSFTLTQKLLSTLELAHILVLFSQFPVYPEFAWRDFWFGCALHTLDLANTCSIFFERVLCAQVGDNEPVTMSQIRAMIVDALQLQAHIVFILLILHMYIQARAAILALPSESAHRSDWKKKLANTIFKL